jgi:hypothetical protein
MPASPGCRWRSRTYIPQSNRVSSRIRGVPEGRGGPHDRRGVRELGYGEDDIDDLVDGAMKQQRLLVGAPREVTEEDLANILRESMENW